MSDNTLAACPSDRRLTVLVADDHALVRGGIKMFVGTIVDNANFVEADDGESLMRAAHWHQSIDLAIVDLNMPSMHGIFRLIELSRRRPSLPVVVVSGMNSPDVVRRVVNVPTVCAFVPKNADPVAMRLAIEAALQGRRVAPAEPASVRLDHALTPRQDEVHRLLSRGMSNKAIAGVLGISEGTVKNHVTEIFRVLNATNRTQAAQLHYESQ